MKLRPERYAEIDIEVIRMFNRIKITCFPIDCFDVCKQLGYKVVAYSSLKENDKEALIDVSKDGCSCLVELERGDRKSVV